MCVCVCVCVCVAAHVRLCPISLETIGTQLLHVAGDNCRCSNLGRNNVLES